MYLDFIGLEYWKSIVFPPSARNADFFSANRTPNFILNALLIISAVDLICCTFWVVINFSKASVSSSRVNLSYAIISTSFVGFSCSAFLLWYHGWSWPGEISWRFPSRLSCEQYLPSLAACRPFSSAALCNYSEASFLYINIIGRFLFSPLTLPRQACANIIYFCRAK